MNKFKEYLKTLGQPIGLYLTPWLIMVSTFWLFNVDQAVILYLTLVQVFIGLILLVIGFINFQKVQNLKQELLDLQEENQALKENYHDYRMETENYFLTWLHQMKTPIAAAQLLLREVPGEARTELQLLLTDIDKYTGMALSYLKLMNPSTDLDFVTISLDELIQPVLKKYRYQFFYHHLSLEYQPIQAQVVTDGQWASIMVEQLLSNAIKYSKEGGFIRIAFDSDTQELAIQDNGIGIQASDLDKIFDKGYVGFNGRLHEKASGLGLYLVDLIAKRLSQSVRVTSELGQGTTFYIKFNLTKM